MSTLIFEKITAIQKDIDAISKDSKNKHQGFNFRGIDAVYNRLHPLLAKHEVFSVPEVLDERSEERVTKSGSTSIYRILKIEYKLYAKDGSFVPSTVIGEGMDSGDKAANKAMSSAHKYMFFQIFSIPTEEVIDPDSETPEPSTPKALQDKANEIIDFADQNKEKMEPSEYNWCMQSMNHAMNQKKLPPVEFLNIALIKIKQKIDSEKKLDEEEIF